MILPDQPLTDAEILIVDDNTANVALLEAILEEAGFTRVTSHTDPREALEAWQAGTFDLMLLDLRMPHLDGYAVMEWIKSQLPADDYLPVIVLTAQIDEATRERALAAGARDFLTKPFDTVEVVQRILNHLEVRAKHNRQRQAVQRQEALLLQQAHDLEYLATHHPIVALPNRPAMIRRLETLLAQGASPLAVLLMQIEPHARLESLAGYDFADRVFRRLGERLREEVAEPMNAGYWGSGSFLVLLHEEEDALLQHANHLFQTVLAPLELDGYPLTFSGRAALIQAPRHGSSAATLLRRAMITLRMAPSLDVPRLTFFNPAFEEAMQERERLIAALREAPHAGQLRLVYQPKVSLATGKIVGAEALMRWHHPSLGTVPPMRFIPLAEETGLIAELGRWAIEEALAAIGRWRRSSGRIVPVAVNLSPRQFELLRLRGESLDEHVREALERHGLPPHSLELELTESSLMQQEETMLAELQQLRALGISLALDDFGTGYSSLARLQQLPVTTLKIDRSLLKGVTANARHRALLGSVIDLGLALSLNVVAEGIETAEEADVLRQLGCPLAQGYHFHRPLPEDDIPALL